MAKFKALLLRAQSRLAPKADFNLSLFALSFTGFCAPAPILCAMGGDAPIIALVGAFCSWQLLDLRSIALCSGQHKRWSTPSPAHLAQAEAVEISKAVGPLTRARPASPPRARL